MGKTIDLTERRQEAGVSVTVQFHTQDSCERRFDVDNRGTNTPEIPQVTGLVVPSRPLLLTTEVSFCRSGPQMGGDRDYEAAILLRHAEEGRIPYTLARSAALWLLTLAAMYADGTIWNDWPADRTDDQEPS